MLHTIKKDVHQIENKPELESFYNTIAKMDIQTAYAYTKSKVEGLNKSEAQNRLKQNGLNSLSSKHRKTWVYFLLNALSDEFILVFFLLGFISIFMKDPIGALIIFILATFSTGIRFYQDFHAYGSSEALKQMIHTTCDVFRDGQISKINIQDLVIGDIIQVRAGSLIPADMILIDVSDLYITQAMFTGESLPVYKSAHPSIVDNQSTRLDNICLMGTSVSSGSAKGLIFACGADTYLGHLAHVIESKKEKTNFEKGIHTISQTLLRYMVIFVSLVFLINGLIKGNWLEAFMFSISVAIGLTPGMLPMIVNGTLSKGSLFLAKKKTIVKHLEAIENMGGIDVLCTDKTGTLTQDNVILKQTIDSTGNPSNTVYTYAYLNSTFSTGIHNSLDEAILSYPSDQIINTKDYTKKGEIPFDFERKRSSVIVEDATHHRLLICKGAHEEIIKHCTMIQADPLIKMNSLTIDALNQQYDHLTEQGYHVLSLALQSLKYTTKEAFQDERDMIFVGFLVFFDPVKPGVKEAIQRLASVNVQVKMITGDSPLVAVQIAKEIGFNNTDFLTGEMVESMDDLALIACIDDIHVYARLTPLQKQRIVNLLKHKGHVVGYLGDGVNDAPSLRHADLGISVDTASDIAKESSDIILLEKSLDVVYDGVMEGRRIYENIMKYMRMSLSSNVGNVFSVLIASIFLPFLPMIPIQILIQNLVYDFTQIAIPWDRVDQNLLQKPKQWDIKHLIQFINVFGLSSSFFDIVTYLVLWFVLGFNLISKQSSFQTGWFIEGLLSQVLIVHFIRTSKISFIQSLADYRLILSSLGGVILGLSIPYAFTLIPGFNFVALPIKDVLIIISIVVAYLITTEIVKHIFFSQGFEPSNI